MNIHECLMKIQTELKAPKKETNSFGGYMYRTIDGIFEAAKPCLSSFGCSLTLTDDLVLIGDRYYVKSTAILTSHETGESVSTSAFAREPITKKGADESQITGAATTYARKYALTALFLLDNSENDPDSEEYEKKVRKNTAKEEKSKEMDSDTKAAYEDFCGVCKENGLSAAKVARDLGLNRNSTVGEFVLATDGLKDLIEKGDGFQNLSKWRAK